MKPLFCEQLLTKRTLPWSQKGKRAARAKIAFFARRDEKKQGSPQNRKIFEGYQYRRFCLITEGRLAHLARAPH